MVVLNRIYTRTGDDGTTALGNGERRKKYDLRVAAYGTLDEVNAVIGVARLHTGGRAALDADAGAHPERPVRSRGRSLLAREGQGAGRRAARRQRAQVEWLEGEIDRSTPSSRRCASSCCRAAAPAAAYLHLARTVCRRAERMMVELQRQPGESVSPEALRYVNRLSDFLFVASRYLNDKGARDVLWVPGAEPLAKS